MNASKEIELLRLAFDSMIVYSTALLAEYAYIMAVGGMFPSYQWGTQTD